MYRKAPLLLVGLLLLSPNGAQAKDLGRISFPVACSPAAREPFVRGVLALHSFFYDEARDEFQAAQKLDPKCAMAIWGEAMSYDETLWGLQDTTAGRAALDKAAGLRATLPPKEAAFFDAAAVLFGIQDTGVAATANTAATASTAGAVPADRPTRVRAYAAALRRMHERWPEDDEITTLLSLALLSALDHAQPSLRMRVEAGAMALDVLRRNPQHPGAAHYVIHAFDDPDHAALALPAAREYAAIAPEAPHARHMPAHIFVELGRWTEAAAACESAWESSLKWIARKKHPQSYADYHSLSWLVPIYTQLGQTAKAEKALSLFEQQVAATGKGTVTYIEVALSYSRDAGRWDQLEGRLALVEKTLKVLDARWEQDKDPDRRPIATITRASLAMARALLAARQGDVQRARKQAAELKAQADKAARQAPRTYGASEKLEAQANELRVQAEIELLQGRAAAAEATLRKAIPIEEILAQTNGAQPTWQSVKERLGEVLLTAGQPDKAGIAFAAALSSTPNRSRALLGAAQAAERLGKGAAAKDSWRALLNNLKLADADFADAATAKSHAAP